MSAEQVIAVVQDNCNECPICMDAIAGVCNRVVTECGHAFHCSCLMQNSVHNGFGCPLCRTKMAEEKEEEDEEDEEGYEDEDEETVFEEDVLTSFRMFHQRINGEEVEEEPSDEWETVDEAEEEEGEEDNAVRMPDVTYVTRKLIERGITFEDLVKNSLRSEHSEWDRYYNDYERRSSEVYGQFRAIITQFQRQEVATEVPAVEENTNNICYTIDTTISQHFNSHYQNKRHQSVTIPEVAEEKSASNPKRREFMLHV